MRTPWHIRAWAMGASLIINGALVTGALYMRAASPMGERIEEGMLISLGDPALTSPDNATSPDAAPAPSPAASPPAFATPKPIRPRQSQPRPDGYATAAVSVPAQSQEQAVQTRAQAAEAASEAVTATAAKAMAATSARPPAGSPTADTLQAHAGSSTSYGARVRAWLESHKTYPKAARLRRQQGVARVVFVLDRAGHVLDCRLVDPSGHALLDQEVLAMVARADPFPAPPHTIKGARIELDAPVEFSLMR